MKFGEYNRYVLIIFTRYFPLFVYAGAKSAMAETLHNGD
jgi:hypothetical protein